MKEYFSVSRRPDLGYRPVYGNSPQIDYVVIWDEAYQFIILLVYCTHEVNSQYPEKDNITYESVWCMKIKVPKD